MRLLVALALLALLALLAHCGPPAQSPAALRPPDETQALELGLETAYFAGGCFWCMEKPFEQLDGVGAVVSGYIDGLVDEPTYHQVSRGSSGHAEAIRVVYDPATVTYPQLLEVFWHNVDATDEGGQFCDRGSQYRTGIFVRNAEERAQAEASRRAAQEELGQRIVTPIADATYFYDAEEYHQDYYRTNPTRYNRYRSGCGRDRRLRELWGAAAAH